MNAPQDYAELYTNKEYRRVAMKLFYATMGKNPSRGRDFEEAFAELTLYLIERRILAHYDPKKGPFLPYLWRAIRNFYIQYSKAALRCPTDVGVSLEREAIERMVVDVSNRVIADIALDDVLNLLDQYARRSLRVTKNGPATLSDVLRLMRQGFTRQEISAYFGVSPTSVANWWRKIQQVAQQGLCPAA